jgi:peptidoglycan lytic transglycosylase
VKKSPFIVSLLLALLAVSCATVPRSRTDYPIGYRETGVASWYGKQFHGRPTANGEIYDMYGLTAAHRLMPLGTVVRVTNRENGRSVTVRVNDRGPFVRGRILDLSYGAAQKLGMTVNGTATVAIEVLSGPNGRKVPGDDFFTVQVGAFSSEQNARRFAKGLSGKYPDVYLVTLQTNQDTIYRVRVGRFHEERRALRMAYRLSNEENLEPFVTRKGP